MSHNVSACVRVCPSLKNGLWRTNPDDIHVFSLQQSDSAAVEPATLHPPSLSATARLLYLQDSLNLNFSGFPRVQAAGVRGLAKGELKLTIKQPGLDLPVQRMMIIGGRETRCS